MSKILKINEETYPDLLRQIYNSPQKLYYKGEIEILKKTCISIVGTRKYSEYGEFITKKIVAELAVLDIAIVSGLAKGIDKIAHESALENGLPTIAVLGSGIENIYPTLNKNLAEKITENGLLLSEYEPKEPPIDFHFPQRNRIVSGLSIATLVIEAPEKSGALITAKLALDQGREIFTVPGDIDRENCIGPLRLLQNGGAYPISSGLEIIKILKEQPHLFKNHKTRKIHKIQSPSPQSPQNPPPISPPPTPQIQYNLTPEEEKVFSATNKRNSRTLEEIQQKTHLPTTNLLSTLSILEIKNLIKTKDGKYLHK